MTCSHCGMSAKPGALFCGECGAKLIASTPSAPPVAPPRPPAAAPPAASAPAASPSGWGAPVITAPPGMPFPPASATAPPIPPAPVIAPPPAVAPAPAVVRTEPPVPTITAPPVAAPLPTPAPEPEPAVEPQPEPAEDPDDERTIVADRRRPAPAWTLTLLDGSTHALAGTTLVGRRARADVRWPGAALVSLVDPAKTVSKLHAVFEVDALGLWVTDLGSTNGVYLRADNGDENRVETGIRTTVPAGSRLMLGDLEVVVAPA